MKVVLDAEPLFGAGGGIKRYVGELTHALNRFDRVDLVLMHDGEVMEPDGIPPRTGGSHGAVAGGLKRLVGQLVPQIRSHRTARRLSRNAAALAALSGPPVYHGTNYLLPENCGPSVVMVHDLTFLRYPETMPSDYAQLLRRGVPESLERARQVLVNSEFTKQEIIDAYGVAPDRITVTPLGVSPGIKEADTSEPPWRPDDGEGFFLAVGTVEPRKNLDVLLTAHAALGPSLRKAFPLVLVGQPGWRVGKTLRRLRAAVDTGHAFWLQKADDAMLARLYRSASALVMPSLYEGFGLPVLEALAAGTPVIASSAGSLPEVAGGQATLLPVDDVERWRSALEVAALEGNDRDLPAAVARKRHAAEWTWERCAEATLQGYGAALEEP